MNEAEVWAMNHNHMPMHEVLLRQRMRGMIGAGNGVKWTCLTGGVFNFDIIRERTYPDGFVVGKRNRFEERDILRCVGGTCGNVSCMLPWLGVTSFPIAHFDLSEEGLQMAADLKRYGADTRFVCNTESGGTTLLTCTHKRDQKTGEHVITYRATSPGSMFPRRKAPRGRDEAPAFLAQMDFTPDVFFFDSPDSGYRVIAEGLRAKGTLVYFEPESDKDRKKFLDAVSKSDIVKFSGEKIADRSFCDAYSNKLFVQTLGKEGLAFKLRDMPWLSVASIPNEKVVDWEGAGDWLTSQLIASLAERNLHSVDKMTEEKVRECLKEASRMASCSVSYMSSKGMIDAVTGCR